MNYKIKTLLLIAVVSFNFSCSKDENEPMVDTETTTEPTNPTPSNPTPTTACVPDYYTEKDGLVVVELESVVDKNSWTQEKAVDGFSGDGYLVWKNSENFNKTDVGTLTYAIKITNTGTYRFLWKTRITEGTSGSDHNDSWLRFPDAADFYGKRGDDIVYPKGTGKTPNPAGSSADGWFKIYMSGAGAWKWNAATSDNDAHDIYVEFKTPGTYKMEVSARSSYHAIDRFVLYKETISKNDATAETNLPSVIVCK